jgi:phosphatidylethanolamine-binding protein (PEBP) family uncharacterized protein
MAIKTIKQVSGLTKKYLNRKQFTKKQLGGSNNNKWQYLPLNTVNKLEKLAEYYNVSHKARGLQKPTKSDKGFLEIYRTHKGNPKAFEHLPVRANKPDGENWAHHREDFCNRRYSMIKGRKGYSLYDENGLPSVMHTNMLMWACSPDASKIIKNTKTILKTLEKAKTNANTNTKAKTKTKQSGGATNADITISIQYAAIGNNNIANGSDLTAEHRAGKLVKEPTVNLESVGVLDNQKYLIVMYDPDAPNGMSAGGNNIYIHWIFIQTGTSNNSDSRNIITEYAQPSPPRGTHRYQFHIYNAAELTKNDIAALQQSGRDFNAEVMNKLTMMKHNPLEYKVLASA